MAVCTEDICATTCWQFTNGASKSSINVFRIELWWYGVCWRTVQLISQNPNKNFGYYEVVAIKCCLRRDYCKAKILKDRMVYCASILLHRRITQTAHSFWEFFQRHSPQFLYFYNFLVLPKTLGHEWSLLKRKISKAGFSKRILSYLTLSLFAWNIARW